MSWFLSLYFLFAVAKRADSCDGKNIKQQHNNLRHLLSPKKNKAIEIKEVGDQQVERNESEKSVGASYGLRDSMSDRKKDSKCI